MERQNVSSSILSMAIQSQSLEIFFRARNELVQLQTKSEDRSWLMSCGKLVPGVGLEHRILNSEPHVFSLFLCGFCHYISCPNCLCLSHPCGHFR